MNSFKKELIYPAIFFVLSVLFFYTNLTFSYLQMGDVLLWDINYIKSAIANKTPYFWNDAYFITQSLATVSLHPKSLLIMLLPVHIYPQATVIFHIFIMGYSFFLFLREKSLNMPAIFFGAVALMFSNSIVTLILPGHLGKFETYAYFPLVLFCLSRAMKYEKNIYFLFTGGALGIAFLGGALDVAMYFSLFLAFYFLFLLYQKKDSLKILDYIKQKYRSILILCLKFTFVALFSFLMSIQIIMTTRSTQEQGAAGVTNKKELWGWATRWSFPPEEVLGFFIPGLFGNYSGDKEAPYWGRIANMPGEPSTSNFSLTSVNIGVITFISIIIALFLKRKKYKEKNFWIASALFFLVASFGRYFPAIYGLLFQIPIFQDARNPNKFIEIIPIPFAVLSAFGFDYLSKVIKAKENNNLIIFLSEEENNYKYIEKVRIAIYAITALSLVAFILTFLAKDFVYSIFLPEWKAENALKIASSINMSFLRLSLLMSTISLFIKNIFSLKEDNIIDKYLPLIPFMLFLIFSIFTTNGMGIFIMGSIFIFAYFIMTSKKTTYYKILPYAFIAMLIFDLFQSANPYIVKSDNDAMYEKTPIVDHILASEGNNKNTMPILIPYLYRYTTHTMPYYNIPLTDPPAISRLDINITKLFNSFRINDYVGYQPRLMDLLGVRFILSPTYLDNSILSNELTKLIEYQDEFSAAVLYELNGFRDRFEYTLNTINANNFDEALIAIKNVDFNLTNDVVLYENIEIKNNNIEEKKSYNIKIISENKNEIILNTKSNKNGLLVLKEMFNENWSVYVDGKKEKILKANILFRGVYLNEGEHEVIFKLEPKMSYFYTTLVCYIILLIAGLFYIAIYKKKLRG